jgi:hypothetical protein
MKEKKILKSGTYKVDEDERTRDERVLTSGYH